ncbi:MAG: hypothetical protein JJ927_15170, partial [Balneola sp.]|nr:hypothetical protein [Balneola sp.]
MKIKLLLISAFLITSCSSSNKNDWQELKLALPQGFPEITYSRTDLSSGYVGSEQKRRLIIDDKTVIEFPVQMSAYGSIKVYSINDSLLYFQEESTGFNVNLKSLEVLELDLRSDSTF